ncbi:uncharacterized protein LOC125198079 [Salvia hispanica]|uniref:uncharacterized protein LOC125198079 n=1 Tax=Salvia hispanica TaxID=49212 RepID=UPI002008F90B|nr:uncharacterized protein LOC125198079 [Salvia hispanica]
MGIGYDPPRARSSIVLNSCVSYSELVALYWDEKEPHRIVLGTKFDSKLHVKTAITMWSLWQEKQFKVVESKLRRWHAVCKFPAGTTATGIGIISTTDAEKARECHRANRDHANFSSAMIALCIRHHVRQCADFKVFSIIADIQDRFGVSISYKKAWYAKRKAIEFVYGGWEESFRQLPSYMFELQSQNPGTIVEWKHNELLSQRRTNVFNYVFWAFGPAIHAFQKAAPVLTIDGTHLRGRFKGKLLVACGFDANKTCLPIAYAVVDEETNDSWSWFLDHVRTHVVKYEREVCIISDRHKGIFKAMESAIMTRAPQIHHKFCLVHVRANVLKKHKGPSVKAKIWKLGVSTQVRKFDRRSRALSDVSRGAMRMLDRITKERWSLCYDGGLRWGVATTNMSECYNNVLRGVRELPIRALVDLTFWRTVKWWVQKKTKIEHTEGELTPWARDMLAKNDSKGRKHYITVIDRDIGKYHVRTRGRIENGVSKGNNVQIVKERLTREGMALRLNIVDVCF